MADSQRGFLLGWIAQRPKQSHSETEVGTAARRIGLSVAALTNVSLPEGTFDSRTTGWRSVFLGGLSRPRGNIVSHRLLVEIGKRESLRRAIVFQSLCVIAKFVECLAPVQMQRSPLPSRTAVFHRL